MQEARFSLKLKPSMDTGIQSLTEIAQGATNLKRKHGGNRTALGLRDVLRPLSFLPLHSRVKFMVRQDYLWRPH